MDKIRLPGGEWFYDPETPLGAEGGFGVVFCGSAEGHDPLAVKKLKIEAKQAAHREMRLAEELAGREFAHVMPILDAGLDAESSSYFVVMPCAEKSLQDELSAGNLFQDQAAAEVLLQIAQGLSEVSDIVHRDLKPGNILYHEGQWKVADFGIARFVEESTSLQTLKGCLTPSYAAPEQWNFERSSAATDIYALGCIGYALLAGQPPFPGPRSEDFRRQHLYENPPPLEGHDAQFRSILSLMLRKVPQARPSRDRVRSIMARVAEGHGSNGSTRALVSLAGADVSVAERQAAEEAKRERVRSDQEFRSRLAQEAFQLLDEIVGRMIQRIVATAGTARQAGPDSVSLGGARLWASPLNDRRPLGRDAFARSKWDVIAGAVVGVQQARPEYVWSASLWYTNRGTGEEYRWWEVSYFAGVCSRVEPRFAPTALDNPADADIAVAPIMGAWEVAERPVPIDGEDEEAFFERWCDRLAKASQGQIAHPRSLPINR